MANEIYHRSNWGNAVNDIAWGDVYEKFDATNEMFVRSDNYENSNETDKLMAAINPKPSILLTPTAYDNGSLHSVKPVKTFGSELVVNGDFATDSDWTKGTGWTISGGKANAVNASNQSLSQSTSSVLLNKKYRISFDVEYISGSAKFQLVGGTTQDVVTITSSGTQVIEVVSNANKSSYRIKGLTTGSGFNASIDNVSVKEVTEADFDFTRGSSATRVNEQGLIEDVQILSGELVQNGDFEEIGSELVTNGDFDTDSDWTKGTGWSISNGKAVGSNSSSSLYQATGSNYTSGKTYKIVFTVSDYVSGSVRPEITNVAGDFVTSSGTFTQYIVATSSSIGEELKGASFTGSIDNVSVKEVGQNWDVTDGWSIENGKANIDTSEGTGNFNQLGVLTIGKKYRLSLSAAMTVGRVKFQSDAAGVFIFSTDVSNHEFIASSTDVSFRRFDTTTSGYIDNVSIIEITDDTNLPRIDYTDGTGSLLLEPQSTNRLTYSEDFTQSIWTNARSSGATNQIIAPDGTTTGYKLIDSTDNNTHLLYSTQIVTASSVFAFSVFLKKGSLNNAFIAFNSSIDQSVVFDLQNGTIVSTGSDVTSSKIESFDNDWYRCSFTHTTTSTVRLYRVGTYNGDISYAGSGSDFVYCWGAQLEQQSYATSYIPTSGSTVTRDADVCNNSGSSDLINSTEGVLYAEIAALANENSTTAISINDGTTSNAVQLFITNTINQIRARVSNSTSQFFEEFTLSDITNFNKIAIKYKQNDFALWVNGNEVATDTSGNTPLGLNNLSFDRGDGANDFNAKVKSVAVFKEALTDAELTALTT